MDNQYQTLSQTPFNDRAPLNNYPKKYERLGVLELGKPYPILGWKLLMVKGNLVVIFDLGEHNVWMPQRFSNYTPYELKSLVDQKMQLVYHGEKQNGTYQCDDIEIID